VIGLRKIVEPFKKAKERVALASIFQGQVANPITAHIDCRRHVFMHRGRIALASFTKRMELRARLFPMATEAKSKPAWNLAALLFQSWIMFIVFRNTILSWPAFQIRSN